MKIIFPVLILFISCLLASTQGCKAQTGDQISGEIKLNSDWKSKVYLVQPRNLQEIASDFLGQIIDSATISEKGKFFFQNLPNSKKKILLELVVQKKGSRYANHLIDSVPDEANYMPFILSKGKSIQIQSDISTFQKSLKFKDPSNENSALISLRDIRLTSFEKYSNGVDQDSHDESLLLEREQAYLDFTQTMMNFADTTTCLEAALVAIKWISPTGDFERMPEFIYGQCQKWQRDQPEHPFIIQLCFQADKNKLPVMTGDKMPDFALPLVSGDTVMLSKLIGKRLTIVDIWASWCAPCRKENQSVLSPLWNAYKDKGFQIIGYSIDNSMTSWKTAIQTDGADWINASHLTGDDTPFLRVLRITTIPANYILDEKGKVIAKNLHGKELMDFIIRQLE